MQKTNRILWTIGCMVVIVCVAGCVSFCTRSFTAQIVDSSKQPVSDAFVLFDYSGWQFPEGHYQVGQSMVKTDKNGKFTIPFFVHSHNPLLTGGAKPEIVYIYSPTTHSYASQIDFLKNFMDERPSIHRISLPDNTDNPAAWAHALDFAVSSFWFMSMEKGVNSIVAPEGVKKKFANMLHSEFESYKVRFGMPSSSTNASFKLDESLVHGWQKELQNQP